MTLVKRTILRQAQYGFFSASQKWDVEASRINRTFHEVELSVGIRQRSMIRVSKNIFKQLLMTLWFKI